MKPEDALKALKDKTTRTLLAGIDLLEIEQYVLPQVLQCVFLGIPHKDIREAMDDGILEAATIA